MKNIIYILKDPRFVGLEAVRYVGKSEQGVSRLKEHLKPSSLKKGTHKDNWIKKLNSLGFQPEIVIVESFTTPDELFEAEAKWYQHYKGLGANLTNLTECGKGTRGYTHKEETIALLKEKALKRDKAPYQNPHNKKQNVIIDGTPYRECVNCKSYKLVDGFAWDDNKNKFQGYCKECQTNYHRQWRIENPTATLEQAEYNLSRLPGAIAGGEASRRPERRAQLSEQRSKAIQAVHTVTGEVLTFKSALEAKEHGFQNSNLGQAIKFNKPYKGYKWSFI